MPRQIKIFQKLLKIPKKSDATSSFGGIIAINRKLDDKIARLITNNFYEVVLAPSYSKSAIKILSAKKNLRLIKTKEIINNNLEEVYSINDGLLIQQKNNIILKNKDIKLASDFKCTDNQKRDLIFAFKICKFTRSNSVVLVKNNKVLAIGSGQTSRIDATKLAINKNKNLKGSYVAASDAFFPFVDNVSLLFKNNCKAIIQPFGSLNDKKIIEFANKKKLSLYFSDYRFFKH